MRILLLDPYEFDTPASEEDIAFAQSHMRNFSDIQSFLQETNAFEGFRQSSTLSVSKPSNLQDLPRATMLLHFLSTQTELTLPNDAQIHVLRDEWDLLDVTFQVGHHFARFIWSTSA